jgi:hypothetical protein
VNTIGNWLHTAFHSSGHGFLSLSVYKIKLFADSQVAPAILSPVCSSSDNPTGGEDRRRSAAIMKSP